MKMFDVHGTVVKFNTNEDEFRDFVLNNYRFFTCGQKRHSVEVNVNLSKSKLFCLHTRPLTHDTVGLSKLGHNVYLLDNGIVTNLGAISIRAVHDGGMLEVDVKYTKDRKFQIRELIEDRSYTAERYQQLMRLAVHYPTFWMLGRRGFHLLHGSAVDCGGKSLLFLGLNGSGKTTLASSLLDAHKIMSDNFILLDEEFVYGFPECLRLPHPPNVQKFGGSVGPKVFGKYHWNPPRDKVSLRSKPWKVFLVQLGSDFFLKSLNRKQALESILGMNDYLHEFHYYSYTNLLGSQTREDSYVSFSERGEFYKLQIGTGESSQMALRQELDKLLEQ